MLNRAVGRLSIFRKQLDCEAFVKVIQEAGTRLSVSGAVLAIANSEAAEPGIDDASVRSAWGQKSRSRHFRYCYVSPARTSVGLFSGQGPSIVERIG